MDKLRFISWTIALLGIYYILVTVFMPLITETSADAVTEVQTSVNAASYGLSIAGLRYAPLFLYFPPAIIAVPLVVLTLKEKI
jgi:hypothetical protein